MKTMKTQTQTQKEAILRHLQSGKTITPLEALNLTDATAWAQGFGI